MAAQKCQRWVCLWTDDLETATSCLRPCLHVCSHFRAKNNHLDMKSWPLAGRNVSHVAQTFPPPCTCSFVSSSVSCNGIYCDQSVPYRPVTRPSHRTASFLFCVNEQRSVPGAPFFSSKGDFTDFRLHLPFTFTLPSGECM